MISWSKGGSPRAVRRGDLMCQQPKGQASSDRRGTGGNRQGCRSTLQENTSQREMRRRQVGERSRTMGSESSPLPQDGCWSRNSSYLVRHPQISVPGQESFNDRILCEKRACVRVTNGTGLPWECSRAKRRTMTLLRKFHHCGER